MSDTKTQLDAITEKNHARAEDLYEKWRRAIRSASLGSDAAFDRYAGREEDTFNALVDFIDSHNLSHSKFDPRTPRPRRKPSPPARGA